MIDKPIQLGDISLSEKDIVQDKDNSILNKSFFSEDFNFPDLVEKKNYLQIKIENLDYHLQIHSKSIKKIFTLISNNDQGELEDNYLDYITCLIGEGDYELDKQQLLTPVSKQIMQNMLEPSNYELLNRTKIYYIDIPKLNLNKNKKIMLRSKSLEKIFSFLNNNIFEMSDYIEVYILSYKEKDSLGENFLLKAKLLGKLSHGLEDIDKENENFTGIKMYNADINVAEKCDRNKLQFLDFYFNNVWNAIEKENLNDENLSFSGTPFEKHSNEEIGNKNINYDLPNSYSINNSNSRNNNNNKNLELKDQNSCAESVCGNICVIF